MKNNKEKTNQSLTADSSWWITWKSGEPTLKLSSSTGGVGIASVQLSSQSLAIILPCTYLFHTSETQSNVFVLQ